MQKLELQSIFLDKENINPVWRFLKTKLSNEKKRFHHIPLASLPAITVPGTRSASLHWTCTSVCLRRWRKGRRAQWGGWTRSRSDETTKGSDACSRTWGLELAGSGDTEWKKGRLTFVPDTEIFQMFKLIAILHFSFMKCEMLGQKKKLSNHTSMFI